MRQKSMLAHMHAWIVDKEAGISDEDALDAHRCSIWANLCDGADLDFDSVPKKKQRRISGKKADPGFLPSIAGSTSECMPLDVIAGLAVPTNTATATPKEWEKLKAARKLKKRRRGKGKGKDKAGEGKAGKGKGKAGHEGKAVKGKEGAGKGKAGKKTEEKEGEKVSWKTFSKREYCKV